MRDVKLDTSARVLVVEDTNMMRVLMMRHLKQAGFTEVTEVTDGQQALDYLANQTVDLILLDINMPVLDGYGTLERLKADPRLREIPIIMITSVDSIESVARCIEMGADDYMPKLFNPILLNARIAACLELNALRRRVAALDAGAG
jgi:DNA-binding response OmpR family regulator